MSTPDLEEKGVVMADGQVYRGTLVTIWDRTILVISLRTSAGALTFAGSVILIVKRSLPLPWEKPQSGQLNPTIPMCNSYIQPA